MCHRAHPTPPCSEVAPTKRPLAVIAGCTRAAWRGGQALAQYPVVFGGPPDVAVVGTLLWDLARWKLLDGRGIMSSDQLPAPLLAEWVANVDGLLRMLRVRPLFC